MSQTRRRIEGPLGDESAGQARMTPPGRGGVAISLEGLRLSMTQLEGTMRSFVDSLDGRAHEDHLPKLKEAVSRMRVSFPNPPPYNENYTLQWNAFTAGSKKSLDLPAVRYLCWKPQVATSDPFLAYLWRAGLKLTSRPLAGLVRSCHAAWKGNPGVYPAAGVIKDLVTQYEGSNQIILKWKSSPNAVFGANGPESLGKAFVEGKKKLNAFFDEWYLDEASPFGREVVEKATRFCREQFGTASSTLMKVLFGELLPWGGWDVSVLRREVGALILKAAGDQARNVLQKFVMIHRSLGDPRLPKNEANWAAMDDEAKSRFEAWLAENPFALMERVYRQGKGWVWQRVGETQYESARFGTGKEML